MSESSNFVRVLARVQHININFLNWETLSFFNIPYANWYLKMKMHCIWCVTRWWMYDLNFVLQHSHLQQWVYSKQIWSLPFTNFLNEYSSSWSMCVQVTGLLLKNCVQVYVQNFPFRKVNLITIDRMHCIVTYYVDGSWKSSLLLPSFYLHCGTFFKLKEGIVKPTNTSLFQRIFLFSTTWAYSCSFHSCKTMNWVLNSYYTVLHFHVELINNIHWNFTIIVIIERWKILLTRKISCVQMYLDIWYYFNNSVLP